jgi:hypothetical protein
MNAAREQEASRDLHRIPHRAARRVHRSPRRATFETSADTLNPSPLSPCFSALKLPVLIDTLAIRK